MYFKQNSLCITGLAPRPCFNLLSLWVFLLGHPWVNWCSVIIFLLASYRLFYISLSVCVCFLRHSLSGLSWISSAGLFLKIQQELRFIFLCTSRPFHILQLPPRKCCDLLFGVFFISYRFVHFYD